LVLKASTPIEIGYLWLSNSAISGQIRSFQEKSSVRIASVAKAGRVASTRVLSNETIMS